MSGPPSSPAKPSSDQIISNISAGRNIGNGDTSVHLTSPDFKPKNTPSDNNTRLDPTTNTTTNPNPNHLNINMSRTDLNPHSMVQVDDDGAHSLHSRRSRRRSRAGLTSGGGGVLISGIYGSLTGGGHDTPGFDSHSYHSRGSRGTGGQGTMYTVIDNLSSSSKINPNLENASLHGPHGASRSVRFAAVAGATQTTISKAKEEILEKHYQELEQHSLKNGPNLGQTGSISVQLAPNGIYLGQNYHYHDGSPPQLLILDKSSLQRQHSSSTLDGMGYHSYDLESGKGGSKGGLGQGGLKNEVLGQSSSGRLVGSSGPYSPIPLHPSTSPNFFHLRNIPILARPRDFDDYCDDDSIESVDLDLNFDEEFQSSSGIPFSNTGHLKYPPALHLEYEYVRNDQYHEDKVPFFYMGLVERQNIVSAQERTLKTILREQLRLDSIVKAEGIRQRLIEKKNGSNNNSFCDVDDHKNDQNGQNLIKNGQNLIKKGQNLIKNDQSGHNFIKNGQNVHQNIPLITDPNDPNRSFSAESMERSSTDASKVGSAQPSVTMTMKTTRQATKSPKSPTPHLPLTQTLCQQPHDSSMDCQRCAEIEEEEALKGELIQYTDADLARPNSMCDFPSRSELLAQLKLAIPLIFSFSAGYAIELVNLSYLGHLNEQALAGGAMASFYQNLTGLSLLNGLNTGIDTFGSQYYGAGQHKMVGTIGLRGSLIGTIAYLIIAVLWWFASIPLGLMGIEDDISQLAQDYCRVCILALPAVQYLDVLRRVLEVQQICVPSMIVNVIGMILAVPLNSFFMDTLGWGFIGPAWAFVIVNWAMFLALLAYFLGSRIYRVCMPTHLFSRSILRNWGQYMSIAAPSTAAVACEWLGFEAQTIVASRLGTRPLSTQSLILSINALIFMIPMSIGVAASCRVGAFLGARKPSAGVLGYYTALRITWLSQFLVGVGLWVFSEQIVSLFTNVEPVKKLSVQVMPMLSLFCIIDGFQGMIQGILRGFGAQTYAMMMNLFWYWVVALPLSIWLSLYAGSHGGEDGEEGGSGLGLVGIWISLLVGSCGILISYLIYLNVASWTKRTNYIYMTLIEEEEEQKALVMRGPDLSESDTDQQHPDQDLITTVIGSLNGSDQYKDEESQLLLDRRRENGSTTTTPQTPQSPRWVGGSNLSTSRTPLSSNGMLSSISDLPGGGGYHPHHHRSPNNDNGGDDSVNDEN